MIKQIIFAATLLAVAGCAADGDKKSLSEHLMYSSVPGFDHRNTLETANALAQSGAPALSIRVDKRAVNGVLFLRENNDGYQAFLSSDNSMIVLKDGGLAATRGLGWDLISSDVPALRRALMHRTKGQPYQRRYHHLNGEDRVTETVVDCVLTDRGQRSIMVDEKPVRTMLHQEKCSNAQVSFQNLYWIGLIGGKIIQSRQWAGLGIGAIAMRRFD